MTMKHVQEIVERTGGLTQLKRQPIHLTVEGFMPLAIEYLGQGPRGGMLLSVMHHFEQNGDLMRDPDLEVEVLPGDRWEPVSYRQDSLGLFQEAVRVGDQGLDVRPQLVADLKAFMRMWDRNLAEQGFVAAARRPAGIAENG